MYELPVLNFLVTVKGIEYTAVIKDALDFLDKFNEQRHILTIDTYMATASLYDPSDLSDLIIECIEDVLHVNLLKFGIKMNASAPVQVVNGVYQTVLGLEDYNDYQQVVTICDGDEPPTEKLSRVMKLFTDYGPTYMDEHVLEVSPSFIRRLRDMASDNVLNSELLDTTENNKLDIIGVRCKAYRDKYLTDRFDILNYLSSNGYGFGFSFNTYMTECKQKLLTLKFEDISYNIVALALASSLSFDKVKENTTHLINEELESMIGDQYTLNKITGNVGIIMNKLNEPDNGVI